MASMSSSRIRLNSGTVPMDFRGKRAGGLHQQARHAALRRFIDGERQVGDRLDLAPRYGRPAGRDGQVPSGVDLYLRGLGSVSGCKWPGGQGPETLADQAPRD